MLASYVGENKEFARQYLAGEFEVVLASPARDVRTFDNPHGPRESLLEQAIVCDFGLVRAWKGDRHGNLVFRSSARNFNPVAAMSGRITIAEVEVLVDAGELDPDEIHTPGAFGHRVVPLSAAQAAQNRIESGRYDDELDSRPDGCTRGRRAE